ncbi:jg753 [Pararge aegeria aegeria]|uniref:Jg753 protein n=1 Tax=Pararge aegeria aegeria TaxID=348720 RepID=A0A8S4S6M9_9NEOP|nr:jg753 [Pararge aegeria aegeria]
MVLGAKKAIQHVPSKGRISIMRIQNFTVQKRQSVVRAVYGSFLVVFAVLLMTVDPATIVTNWFLDVQEGRLIYRMWNKPTYEVYSEVYIFNYTNVDQFMSGEDKQLNLEEIGPFKFQEIRENENITIDRERGVMTMNPTLRLNFLPNESIAHYKDVQIMVPNIALLYNNVLRAVLKKPRRCSASRCLRMRGWRFLRDHPQACCVNDDPPQYTGMQAGQLSLGVLGWCALLTRYGQMSEIKISIFFMAISTLLADNTGYFVNVGAYYSISALGSKLFRNMTAEAYLWGYDDPLVSLASKLLPGWIDFGKIGILDRFYAPKKEETEVELRNLSRKFSINTWNKLTGLEEQGFTDWNTSIPCNQVKGTYEALILTPGLSKDVDIPVFRKQACRTYPFTFLEEVKSHGVNLYRFMMDKNAFNKTSRYACECTKNCLPDGFVDISSCYYGFPITLSKPHFLDVDPANQAHYRGFSPDPIKHRSILDVEPVS